MKKLLLLGAIIFLIAGISGWIFLKNDKPQEVNDSHQESMDASGLCETTVKSYVGLSEADAVAQAKRTGHVAVRVVARDGQQFAVTQDYNMDRLNFEISGGKVTKATCG